jgi:hypothetical protein
MREIARKGQGVHMVGNDEAAHLARAILNFRRHRSQIISADIFGEPAWELLLELFIADASGVAMTGRAVTERSGTPHRVMSHWLKHLTAQGLLIGDGTGDLDDELTLSGIAMNQVEDLLRHAVTLKDAFLSVPSNRQ